MRHKEKNQMQQRKRKRGMLGTLLLTAILATAIFAYTASITVNPSGANIGYGNATVAAGYTVSAIDYTVSADFKNVNAVQFNITPLPTGSGLNGSRITQRWNNVDHLRDHR
jgi:hypothetical protein